MAWREEAQFGNANVQGTLAVAGATTQTDAMTVAGAVTTDVLQAAEHGAGAIGTGGILAPRTYRRTENGDIITTIQVDITGLTVTGTTQGFAIGLAGVDGCYIGRYVLATYGNVYKIEMICLEAPTKLSGTAIEADIDLCYTTAADVQAGEDVDVDIIAAARDWAAGEMAVAITPKLTPDGDYLYLGAGDTAGNAGIYAGGQFIIKFYGHAVLA